MGAAYLAGLAVGFWRSGLDALAAGKSRRFDPKTPRSQALSLRDRWNEAVARSKAWDRST
jgi:glycerol kinase